MSTSSRPITGLPVHRISLPTPFPVGPVNVYVLTGHPLTLVDTGPSYEPARRALGEGLGRLGLSPADIERIVITHPHLDHYGLAAEIAEHSGAQVAAHAGAVTRLEAPPHGIGEVERSALEAVLDRAGAPAGFTAELLESFAYTAGLGCRVRVDRLLAGGDIVETGGAAWRVIDTPGHSPGSLCLHEAVGSRLFSGDCLLSRITSNAIIELAPDGAAPGAAPDATSAPGAAPGAPPALIRLRSLEIYIASLHRVSALEVTQVLPGHGDPFSGHRDLIAGRMRHYESRKQTIAGVLGERGPSTAFDLAVALFPEQAQAVGRYLSLSEVLGHLDLLETEGRVARTGNGRVDLYEPGDRSDPGAPGGRSDPGASDDADKKEPEVRE